MSLVRQYRRMIGKDPVDVLEKRVKQNLQILYDALNDLYSWTDMSIVDISNYANFGTTEGATSLYTLNSEAAALTGAPFPLMHTIPNGYHLVDLVLFYGITNTITTSPAVNILKRDQTTHENLTIIETFAAPLQTAIGDHETTMTLTTPEPIEATEDALYITLTGGNQGGANRYNFAHVRLHFQPITTFDWG